MGMSWTIIRIPESWRSDVAHFGHIVDVVLDIETFCQCGNKVFPGSKVGLWRSSKDREHDKIVSCVICRRPKTILGERRWLIQRYSALKNSMERTPALVTIENELDLNWRRAEIVLMKLFEHLPKCDECANIATYQLQNGPFYCDEHSQSHSTAQRVPWYRELKELGTDG